MVPDLHDDVPPDGVQTHTKAIHWLMLHHDARQNARLAAIGKNQCAFGVWFNMLVFASEQERRGLIPAMPERRLAIEVAGGDIDLMRSTLADLVEIGLIQARDGGEIFFPGFERRNRCKPRKPSDAPQAWAARKEKQRAREAVEREQQASMSRDVTRASSDVTLQSRHLDREKEREGDMLSQMEAEQRVGRSRPRRLGSTPSTGGDGSFETFWKEYPRKISRVDASSTWRKLELTVGDVEKVLAALRRFIVQEWSNKEREFIPYPATWLNRQPWLDQDPSLDDGPGEKDAEDRIVERMVGRNSQWPDRRHVEDWVERANRSGASLSLEAHLAMLDGHGLKPTLLAIHRAHLAAKEGGAERG